MADGTTVLRHSPAAIPNLSNVVEVAAGGYHTVFLTSDGLVRVADVFEISDAGEIRPYNLDMLFQFPHELAALGSVDRLKSYLAAP